MSRTILLTLVVCTLAAAQERPAVKCAEDSPERRGEEGCTILANRPLVGPRTAETYWHIDRFDSLEAAKKVAGPNGVAAEAHGSFWLMTVEAKTEDHHGGHHIAWIGPIALPAADSYSMRVQSSLLMPGARTPAHTHPGPEVIYIVDGEQCMETPDIGHRLGPGQSYVVPGDVVHRGRPIGSKARRALALNLYDAAHPVSHDLTDPPPLVPCIEQQLMEIETAWRKARVGGDIAFLESLYAKELRITGTDGSVIERDTDIALFASGQIRPQFIEAEDMRVSVYGDVAVVTGRDHLKGSYKGGQREGRVRFTHVFVHRDGRWQLVASQGTWVQEKP